MAAATSVLAGVVVVVALLVSQAEAGLKCYSCFMSESVPGRCGDPFNRANDDLMEDCDKVRPSGMAGYSFCKKIKQSKDSRYRSVIVTRMCYWSMNESRACDETKAESKRQGLELLHCSACSKDGCNGSVALLPTAALCVVMLPLFFFFFDA